MPLASLLSRPLRIDAATRTLSPPSVARVCVEVNLLRTLPNQIWIGHGDTGFWQSVIYDNLHSYCSSCSRLGHLDGECATTVSSIPQMKVWKPKNKEPESNPNLPASSGVALSEKESAPEDSTVPHTAIVPEPAPVIQFPTHPLPQRSTQVLLPEIVPEPAPEDSTVPHTAIVPEPAPVIQLPTNPLPPRST